jgi:quercetin dioxygenase-like cupin family protein
MRTLLIAALLAASVLSAQTPPAPEPPIGLTPEAMVWTDGPSTLPPGSKMAVLEGNPKADGMFTMRVRIPAGSAIPPHWHPRQERVTILSGAVDLGFGSIANAGKTRHYAAGSFYVNPPRVMHFLFFPEATEMQMTGIGPWELQTSDITPQPGVVPTSTVTIRSITPLPGSELTPSTTVTAVVDYSIGSFKPSTYWLDFVFETTTPNKTFGVGPEVIAPGDRPLAPPRPNYVISPGGTITLTQELARVLPNPQLKHPIRMRVYVHEQKSEMSNRVVGMSDWIEYR